MRKLFQTVLFITTVSLLFTQSTGYLFAAYTYGGQGLINNVTRMQNQASNTAARQQERLSDIISRSNTLISTRLSSLNAVTTRIQNDSNLSSTEKSTLSSEVQTDISGLTALQTKIDADTQAATARADEKTIITNYYIYEMFLPKIRILIVLYNLQTIAGNIQALIPQLQSLITSLPSQDSSTITQLQSLLSNISTQLQTINTTVTTDITTVQGVSVSTQDPAATFSQVRSDISTIVRTDLNTIKSDFAQMRPLFKQATGSTSVSPAATAIPTP